jgi:hypothetical protein
MPGGWIAPTSLPMFNVGTMLLLTDGCVLAQDSGTRHWWKLTPNAAGRYSGGTWSRVRSSRNAPLYFASAVLRDGRVFVAGGEDNNGQPADLRAAELYDPVSDQWRDLPTPAGWAAIGDAPCCVLPNGTVLLGSITDNRCALFDPDTLTWTATGNKLNGSSNEETWTLLPDGSVLTAECFGHPASQRYVDGAWILNGATQPDLVEAASNEIGPAILLPNGLVFAIGATGGTSLFTANAVRTQPGTWAAGPNFPAGYGAKDAPACLLPNGRVLCAAGPVDGVAGNYAGPTQFYEYDPAANTLTLLPAQPAGAVAAPYTGRMLLLPDGSVLFSNGTSTIWFYEPNGAPDPTWLPFVSEWPTDIAAGATGRLYGTQFNGLSQACAYGDDASMATNYPIVRLRSTEQNGPVIYCRSFDHSTMAVASGAAVVSTSFAVPDRTPIGFYQLAVIANGIASAEHAISVNAPSDRREFRDTTEEQNLQHELFWRDLNEVHLLMDFISGRADKSLADLNNVPDPDNPGQNLKPEAVVQKVCLIRFPPVGDATSRARQAALLLTVKDRLNALADPARGVSIAYTSMFSGVSQSTSEPQGPGFFASVADYIGFPVQRAPAVPEPPKHAYAFATEAYPNLSVHARKFRKWFVWLPTFAAVWAILTALVYWDVALSSAALNKVTGFEEQQAALAQPGHTFVPDTKRCNALTRLATGAPAIGAPAIGAQADDSIEVCRRFGDLQFHLVAAREDLAAITERHLWRHPVGWVMRSFSGKLNRIGSTDHPREQFAAVVVSVFTNYIVPMMFGLLGTLAGVVRSIWGKVRESTLRPQDRRLAVANVPLGLVAGLAIGLIVSPSGTPPAGVSATAGSITLSATALAFLAGYGAEAFFTMIDELLKRIFTLGNGGTTK